MALSLNANMIMANAGIYVFLGLIILAIVFVVSIVTSRRKRKRQRLEQERKNKEIAAQVANNYDFLIFGDPDGESEEGGFSSAHGDVLRDDGIGSTTSIMLKPIKSKDRPPRKPKGELAKREPQEKESSFNKDHIYDEEASRKLGSIVMYVDHEGLFRYKLLTSKHETVAISKAHPTKYACYKSIKLAIKAAKFAQVADTSDEDYLEMLREYTFAVYKDKQGMFRFKLKSCTLQDIMASPGYNYKFNCVNGIKSVRNILEFHTIVDDTKVEDPIDYLAQVRSFWEDDGSLDKIDDSRLEVS